MTPLQGQIAHTFKERIEDQTLKYSVTGSSTSPTQELEYWLSSPSQSISPPPSCSGWLWACRWQGPCLQPTQQSPPSCPGGPGCRYCTKVSKSLLFYALFLFKRVGSQVGTPHNKVCQCLEKKKKRI